MGVGGSKRGDDYDKLQEEVHRKRTAGMTYNDIFSQIVEDGKTGGDATERGFGKSRRSEAERRKSKKRDTASKMLLALRGKRGSDSERSRSTSPRRIGTAGGKPPSTKKAWGRAARGEPHSVDPPANDSGRSLDGSETRTYLLDDGTPKSESMLDPFAEDKSGTSRCQKPSFSDSLKKPLRRGQIFDKGVDMQDLFSEDADGDPLEYGGGNALGETWRKPLSIEDEATDIVIGALKKFFFLEADDEQDDKGSREGNVAPGASLAMLMRAMERSELPAGVFLMEQGEEGNHMFVLEEGNMEVIIDQQAVRVIGSGDRVGELALLYNAPRSASVRTLTSCVLWGIHRKVFKAVQAMSASGNLIARSTHLYHMPWLRVLGSSELSKLATLFKTAQFAEGDVLLHQGEVIDRCFLVESGEVICMSQKHPEARSARDDHRTSAAMDAGANAWLGDGNRDYESQAGARDCEEVERLMMVTRPGKRANSPVALKESKDAEDSRRASLDCASPDRKPRVKFGIKIEGVNGLGATRLDCEPCWDESRRQVRYGKGCFLGVPVLLASAEYEIEGLPAWEVTASASGARPRTDEAKGEPTPGYDGFGVTSPVTLMARGDVRVSHIDVAGFARTVGPFGKVLDSIADGGRMFSPLRGVHAGEVKTQRFLEDELEGQTGTLRGKSLDMNDFEKLAFLGQGSFGYVVMVKKRGKPMQGRRFALKSLSKHAVVEGKQVNHVLDEKAALETFDHPFLLKLYATFQDTNRLYFLTEVLEGGELWSVLYEGTSGYNLGLPPDHVFFYSAVVIEALDYVHKKGMAYRDLKPENLIVDDTGYLRIVDMGFTKRIPFLMTLNGETRIHPCSHTMCGTPEYLAPEFIFHKGHDKSVDLWAFGVLLYEMVEGRTPFAPAGGGEDITTLFTNIALTRKRRIFFGEDFDARSNGTQCRELIQSVVVYEPSERLGNFANGVEDIKNHSYFIGMNWERLARKQERVPWIPRRRAQDSEPDGIPGMNDVYRGSQTVFADF